MVVSFYLKNNTGNLFIMAGGGNAYLQAVDNENGVKVYPNAKVELYYDNSKKFETLTNGVRVTGQVDVNGGSIALEDNRSLFLGAGDDLQIYHDGTNNILLANSGDLNIRMNSSENAIVSRQNGAVELYHNNSKKFETISDGAKVTGRLQVTNYLEFDDDVEAYWGTGHDLQIVHDGSASHILDNVSNTLRISANSIALQSGDKSEAGLVYSKNGATELYYDNSKKFETTSYGVAFCRSS